MPASKLGFAMDDREIVVARTTDKANVEDSEAAGTAVRLDLLLGAEEGRPIAGEVKIRTH